MAKRKRLTPANPAFLDTPQPAAALRAAPIADVAREAATTAAAEELAQTLTEARRQGRMVVSVPLDQIALDHLVRDRISVDEDEMAALKASIRARGQQTPVELVDLSPPSSSAAVGQKSPPSSSAAIGQKSPPSSSEAVGQKYGLISGWRRIKALSALHEETGEDRFGQVLALLRHPEDVAEAYQAMVEENEIRANLSHFERARIVAKAVEQGVFETERTALQTLFESASRARRSKIGSFLPVVAELDGFLRFPQAMTERMGLALARGMEAEDSLAPRLRRHLKSGSPGSPEAEQSLLEEVLNGAPLRPQPQPQPEPVPATSPQPAPASAEPKPAPRRIQIVTGIALTEEDGRLALEGNRVDTALRDRLIAWLRAQS